MSTKLLLLVGTPKGAFIVEGDQRRANWRLRGPFCEAWPIHHVAYDPATNALYAGGGNPWFGPAVWKSSDLGETWSHSGEGLTYGDGERDVKTVWCVAPAHGKLYAGVDPAGLFLSEDEGRTWQHVKGLTHHPTRPRWQPGNAGLCLHSIVPHPDDPHQMWVAISAVGTFYTADGGATWETQNRGVRMDYYPEKYPEFGQCVHHLLLASGDGQRLYQQNHCGVYRSRSGGREWEEISAGLPSTFGFPMAVHPREPETIYVAPLNGDIRGRFMPDARAAVWRSRDAGNSWARLSDGLPQENAYFGVLRQSLTVDPLTPAGVYFGTTNGQLYASADEGETWHTVAEYLPPIWSVEAAVVES